MKLQIIKMVASIIAASIVMILHEFPKALSYGLTNKDKKNKHKIFHLHHYIDPIGMLFFIAFGAGFSKPYMYRIKDRKTNTRLGVLGFITLLFLFAISMIILKDQFGMDSSLSYYTSEPKVQIFLKYMFVFIARSSICMFLVNLFPIATFNMGLLLAGKSPAKFIAMIRSDYMLKMTLLLFILLGFVTSIGGMIMTQLL